MADDKPKAKWSLKERAGHIESKSTWRSPDKVDTRKQTDRKPDAKAQKMAKKRSK